MSKIDGRLLCMAVQLPGNFHAMCEAAPRLMINAGGGSIRGEHGFVGDGAHEGYILIKAKDAAMYLEANIVHLMTKSAARVDSARIAAGRGPLHALVIEADWPEYGPALAALNARIAMGARPDR